MSKRRACWQKQSSPSWLGRKSHWTSRFFKYQDFYEVLENVTWLWRIFGIFPITIRTRNYKKKYELSIFYAAVGLLIYVIFIVDFFYVIIIFQREFGHAPLLTAATIFIRAVSSLLCTGFTMVWRTVKFKEFAELVSDLSTRETIMEKSNCRIDYDSSSKTIRIYVWTTFVVMMYFMMYDLSISFHSYGIQIEWIIWLLPLQVQVMDVTILVSLVGFLGLKCHSLNNKISNVVTRANASSPKVVSRVIVTSDICAENLRVLSKHHYDICKLGKRINRHYYPIVIINVTTAFVILSTTLYYIFNEIQEGEKMKAEVILSYIHMELSYALPIIIIVMICNWTSNQAIYTGKLIHEIRVTEMDSQLYDAIKSFSLQLHHQKLEFTAGELFPLDSSLLQTMAAKITTYLVILIQFQPRLKWDWEGN